MPCFSFLLALELDNDVLTRIAYTTTLPVPKFDIISLYGLGPIAASFARTDPVTGEKINRLRKSYEGKIKGLGLAGRNKPVKQEPGAPGGLRNLMMWPDEEWYNQKVAGKEITIAEPDTAFYKQQLRAMKMEPGITPRNEYWEDVLGHEKSSKNAAEQLPKKLVSSSFKNTPQSNGTPAAQASSATVAPDPGRPKRAGRKRSYHDSSFVGYGEGFPDDDDLEGSLYSNDDDGGSVGKKKRKKMVRSSCMFIALPILGTLSFILFDITYLPYYSKNMQQEVLRLSSEAAATALECSALVPDDNRPRISNCDPWSIIAKLPFQTMNPCIRMD